ncbi:CHASE3 domain-containing protein [Sphingomicrobium lutaoense]|uniref:histidine kinase n=1 Tax=Sphingomicrobium lutaoense TaxID=515949 RepID=A0A839Z132_9SPHN|nr:CHASE3 domain-containing protein [Sphingomicrobium lutaoense]MBB3763393.1 two-component sensor histidine kinase/CHASE3 domain sensor protein [Sphingomicrobium lutaoense]
MRRLLLMGPRVPSLILLLLVAAAIAGIVLSLVTTFEAERELRDQVGQTNDILAELRNVQRAATDAEAGQRGYVLTGDERYLENYRSGADVALPALEQLEDRIGPYPSEVQEDGLARLRRAVTSKMRELEIGVDLVRQGQREDAMRWVDTDTGLELMDEIRSVTEAMENHEQSVLADDLEAVERAAARTQPIILILSALVLAFLAIGLFGSMRMLRAERAARRAESDRRAREQADLLARELNHRVKNIFAVVQAVVGSTLRSEEEVQAAAQKVSERIQALSIAHEVSQGALDRPTASLELLLETTLAPYDDPRRTLEIDGPAVELANDQITPIGMIVHELATNAIKYGSWSVDDGAVEIHWTAEPVGNNGVRVEWHWREKGGPVPQPNEGTRRSGFGSRMIDMSVRQLGASYEREWLDEGLHVRLVFSLSVDGAGNQ